MLKQINLLRRYVIAALLLVPMASACANNPENLTVLDIAGFELPESVLHDQQNDVYLVSNIAGKIPEKDDNGFISIVATDGKLLDLKWIDGASDDVILHSPKGMAIVGDRLFVADIDTVRVFDRNSGDVIDDILVKGATFLNDIVVGTDNSLYVSDSAIEFNGEGFDATNQDAIYQINSNGTVNEFSKGIQLAQPNGLEMIDGQLGAVTRGGAEFYTLDKNAEKQRTISLPGKILDGLVHTQSGDIWISSWETSTIYQLNSRGELIQQNKLPVPAANIGYDRKRHLLLLPLLKSSQIALFPAN